MLTLKSTRAACFSIVNLVCIGQRVNAHATLGEGVSNFTQIITENSGHYIQVEEPQLVLDAIESFQ